LIFLYLKLLAKIGQDVFVGAFTYIGENVSIGDNVKIYPNCFIGENITVASRLIQVDQGLAFFPIARGSRIRFYIL